MKYNCIFISEDIPKKIENFLKARSNLLIKLPQNEYLPIPTAKHADMQMININDTLIITKELYEKLNIPNNYSISFAHRNHADNYPNDVNLNALLLDKYLICNVKSVDKRIVEVCNEKEIEIINTRQGYAKCSTLVINDFAVISADDGIIKASQRLGYDCLQISEGNISLPGYNYGFIGGASFYDKHLKTVYFFGDITHHSSYSEIVKFCSKHNTDIVSLSPMSLTDFGGAVTL